MLYFTGAYMENEESNHAQSSSFIIIIIIIIGNTPTGGAMQNYNYFKYQYNTIDT